MKGTLAVALSVGLLAAACGGSSSTSTLPTPIAPSTTDTFTDMLDPGASKSHNFTVSKAGEVDITLTSVAGTTTPSTVFVGLGVGVPDATATSTAGCALISGFGGAVQSGQTPQIVGNANPGTFCAYIVDIGNLADTVNYTITVTHP